MSNEQIKKKNHPEDTSLTGQGIKPALTQSNRYFYSWWTTKSRMLSTQTGIYCLFEANHYAEAVILLKKYLRIHSRKGPGEGPGHPKTGNTSEEARKQKKHLHLFPEVVKDWPVTCYNWSGSTESFTGLQ